MGRRGRAREFSPRARASHPQIADHLLSHDDWDKQHRVLHKAFLAACQSALLVRFCDHIYDLNIRYRRIAGPLVDDARNIDAEHAAIVEAVLARDENRSVYLLVAHYTHTADFVRARLD